MSMVPKKAYLTVGFISIVIIIGSIVFCVRMQIAKREQAAFTTIFTTATHQFEEAMALITLNPIRARELLRLAHDGLEEYCAHHKLSKMQKKQVLGLSAKIKDGLVVAGKTFDEKLVPFLDISLVRNNGQGIALSTYKDTIAILDQVNKSIYRINVASKAASIIYGGNEIADAIDIAFYNDQVFVLTKAGIVYIQNNKPRIMVSYDEHWEAPIAIAAYADNIYILDSKANQIWKYAIDATNSEIPALPAGRRKYLAADTFPDFSSSIGLAIDGSVWVSGSQIVKFTYGTFQSYTITGLEDALGSAISLYTSEDDTNLYILDREHKRIVVVDKQGVYQAQYKWNEDIIISDFMVSEKLKKILLLSVNMMYEIVLK